MNLQATSLSLAANGSTHLRAEKLPEQQAGRAHPAAANCQALWECEPITTGYSLPAAMTDRSYGLWGRESQQRLCMRRLEDGGALVAAGPAQPSWVGGLSWPSSSCAAPPQQPPPPRDRDTAWGTFTLVHLASVPGCHSSPVTRREACHSLALITYLWLKVLQCLGPFSLHTVSSVSDTLIYWFKHRLFTVNQTKGY